VGLAVSESAGSDTARQPAIVRVVQEVAAYLGNTPRQEGRTIAAALGELGKAATSATSPPRGRAEQVVLDLLTSA
jgi:hypothetical protein